jgi:hypothetical protein
MNTPDLTPVESKNISAIGYRLHDQSLFIQFRGRGGATGSTYRYVAVPPELYHRFMNATSKGQFFAAEIKGSGPGPRYSYEKVSQIDGPPSRRSSEHYSQNIVPCFVEVRQVVRGHPSP